MQTQVRSDSVVKGEVLRGAGDRGSEPVDHGAASPSRQTVNPAELVSDHFATEPTAANADDGTTAPRLLAGLPVVGFPRLAVVWADTKYRNKALDRWLAGQDRLRLEVTSKPEGSEGFVPLKKRWAVEQTFGCLLRWRRLVRDFERLPETSAAMVKLSSIHRMARRARPPRWRKKFRYKRPPKTAA